MKTLLAFGLVVLGMASDFVLALQLGVYQRYPLAHNALMVAGCVWLAVLVRRSPGWWRGIALAAGVLLTLLYAWYTLSYSTYPEPEGEQVETLPTLTLANQDGRTVPVLVENDRGTLLVFYRGFW